MNIQKYISPFRDLLVRNADKIEARNKAIQEANEPFNAIQSIHVHFSESAGSKDKDIAKMTACIKAGNPFGLKLGKNKFIAFIPEKLTAYMFGHSADKQMFSSRQAMADAVSLTYLTHKEFVSTKKLLNTLNVFKSLEHTQQKKIDP